MKNQLKTNNKITGATKVFGIIGDPVTFSLSPLIHNTVSNNLSNDMVYVAFPVDKGDIQKAILGGAALNIQGFNVTKPYKQDVIPYLKYIDPLAQKIGAINTLKYKDGGYYGYNTDAPGLYMSLEENNISIKDQDIVILGAGGAARAVAMLVAEHGAKSITILNRTLDNAMALEMEVKKHYNINIQSNTIDNWGIGPKSSICFQTTSVGMGSNEALAPIMNMEFYDTIKVAVDLIYNPSETLFLKNAKEKGAYTINGFGMLFYQAIKSYEIWNEITIEKDRLTVLFNEIETLYNQIK